jgi:hypothetical protein
VRARTLLLAGVLLVGGACTDGGVEGVSSDRAPAGPSAAIPPPGAVATQAPPELPARGPAMPADSISLEELHRQGRTDVVR